MNPSPRHRQSFARTGRNWWPVETGGRSKLVGVTFWRSFEPTLDQDRNRRSFSSPIGRQIVFGISGYKASRRMLRIQVATLCMPFDYRSSDGDRSATVFHRNTPRLGCVRAVVLVVGRTHHSFFKRLPIGDSCVPANDGTGGFFVPLLGPFRCSDSAAKQ